MASLAKSLGVAMTAGLVFVDNSYTYRDCQVCRARCEMPLVTRCNNCFARGCKVEPPRQSGRTHANIAALHTGVKDLLLIHAAQHRDHWRQMYPAVAKKIVTVFDALQNSVLRGMDERKVAVDHAVWERHGQPSADDVEQLDHELRAIRYWDYLNK